MGQLHDRAAADFEYFKDNMLRLLSDRDAMLEEQKNYRQFTDMMPKVDRDQAKQEMGAWLADYFGDAGYANWETQCQLYKAMVMTAFPPIDPLDTAKPDYGTMPVTEFEDNLATFLGVMDNHLAAEERRLNPGVSTRGMTTLI